MVSYNIYIAGDQEQKFIMNFSRNIRHRLSTQKAHQSKALVKVVLSMTIFTFLQLVTCCWKHLLYPEDALPRPGIHLVGFEKNQPKLCSTATGHCLDCCRYNCTLYHVNICPYVFMVTDSVTTVTLEPFLFQPTTQRYLHVSIVKTIKSGAKDTYCR